MYNVSIRVSYMKDMRNIERYVRVFEKWDECELGKQFLPFYYMVIYRMCPLSVSGRYNTSLGLYGI